MMNISLEEMDITETRLVVYINNSSSWQERWIPNWSNAQIKDFTGNSTWLPTTQGDRVKNTMPSNGYSVWSINM
jgi:alpha-amylase